MASAISINTCATAINAAKGDTKPITPVSPSESGSDAMYDYRPTPVHVGSTRRCNYCGITSTPMWRHGPGEYVHLCNSCGVKWRRGKILQNTKHRHHLCKKEKMNGSPNIAKRKLILADSPEKPTMPKTPTTPLAEQPLFDMELDDTMLELPASAASLQQASLITEFASLLTGTPVSKMAEFVAILRENSGAEITVASLDSATWQKLRALI